MIIKQHIKEFEAMGLGMFVHFGIQEKKLWKKLIG